MRKYLELLKVSVRVNISYKFEFVIYSIATLVGMSVFYFVWSAIYSYNHVQTIGGLTLQQIITYAVVSMSIGSVIFPRTDRFFIYYDITQGAITTALARPVRVLPYIFFRDNGSNILSFFTDTIPSLILAFLIFRMTIPNILNIAAFFISIFLSLLIAFSIAFIIWLSAFWTEKADGIRRFKDALIDLFSGSIIPIYLFPLWMQPVLFLLPFQAIFNIPLSIFIEKISGTQILFALSQQLFWAAFFLILGHFLWKKARMKYNAHGG